MSEKVFSKNDFDLCYEFLPCPSTQVLSIEQQMLLEQVNTGGDCPQFVIELGQSPPVFTCTTQLSPTDQRSIELVARSAREA